MGMTTPLAGRVGNTSLPKSHALLPLLEAVVNGIQAIQTRPETDARPGRLSITILRDRPDGVCPRVLAARLWTRSSVSKWRTTESGSHPRT
jgi:hypothetical protein